MDFAICLQFEIFLTLASHWIESLSSSFRIAEHLTANLSLIFVLASFGFEIECSPFFFGLDLTANLRVLKPIENSLSILHQLHHQKILLNHHSDQVHRSSQGNQREQEHQQESAHRLDLSGRSTLSLALHRLEILNEGRHSKLSIVKRHLESSTEGRHLAFLVDKHRSDFAVEHLKFRSIKYHKTQFSMQSIAKQS